MADHISSTSKPLKCSWTFWIIFPHETALLIEVKRDVITQIDTSSAARGGAGSFEK